MTKRLFLFATTFLFLLGNGGPQVDLTIEDAEVDLGALFEVGVADTQECGEVVVTVSNPRAVTLRDVLSPSSSDLLDDPASAPRVRAEGGWTYPASEDHTLVFQCLRPSEGTTITVRSGSGATTTVACVEEPAEPDPAPSMCEPAIDPNPANLFGDLLAQLTGDPLSDGFLDELVCDEEGEPTLHSNGEQEAPALDAWDIRLSGGAVREIPGGWPTSLSCDDSGVYCSDLYASTDEETWLLFGMGQAAPLPIGEAGDLSTFALVCDTDDDPDNDWTPHPSYPADFWQDTDKWWSFDSNAAGAMTFSGRIVTNGSAEPMETGARLLVDENVLLFAVPRSEFDGDTAGCRVTAFRHAGDWGMEDNDWNGDVTPPVDEDLVRIDLPEAAPVDEAPEATGTVSCGGPRDVYILFAPAAGRLEVVVDTVSDATTFDPLAWIGDEAALDAGDWLATGDDEVDCSFPPPNYSCPAFGIDIEVPGQMLMLGVAGYETGCNESGVGAYSLEVHLDGQPLGFSLFLDDE